MCRFTGYIEITKTLLANGANINQPMNKTGWAPLHISADTGHEKIVNMLIEHGADITLTTPEHLTGRKIVLIIWDISFLRL